MGVPAKLIAAPITRTVKSRSMIALQSPLNLYISGMNGN
jgi:hypothetical protein